MLWSVHSCQSALPCPLPLSEAPGSTDLSVEYWTLFCVLDETIGETIYLTQGGKSCGDEINLGLEC